MGLLDDAIREHLDLKRARGGDPAEIERMEREALGPVRREPTIGSTRFEDAGEPMPRAYEESELHEPHLADLEDLQDLGYHDSMAPRPHPHHEDYPYDEHPEPHSEFDDARTELFEPEPEVVEPPKRRFLRRNRPASLAEPAPLPDPGFHEEPPTELHQLVGYEDARGEALGHEEPEPASDGTPEPASDGTPEPNSGSAPEPNSGSAPEPDSGSAPEPTSGSATKVGPGPPNLRFEQPPKRPRFTAEPPSLSAKTDAPTEVAAPPDEPTAPAAPGEATRPPGEPVSATPAPLPPTPSREPAAPPPPAPPPPAPAAAEYEHFDEPPGDDPAAQETTEFDVENHLAEPPVSEDEDVLEVTPDFLQDTPEHDRLWFEQRPPKDFDFNG